MNVSRQHEELMKEQVSTRVNSPKNNDPSLIEPVS
jgi:putative SOS response-associated peptidase YedK